VTLFIFLGLTLPSLFFIIWGLICLYNEGEWEFPWDTSERRKVRRKEDEERRKEYEELIKKVGDIQIVERVNEEGKEYYVVERFSDNGISHLRWRSFLFTEEPKHEEDIDLYSRNTTIIPIEYDTPEEAQEAANEKLNEIARKEKAHNYRKVIGEFTP